MEIWQKLVSQQKNYSVFEKISLSTQKEMPTLMLCGVPSLLECAKKEEKTCNFCTFPVTNYFYFHNTYLLTPCQDAAFLV